MNLRELLDELRRNILRDVSTAANGRIKDDSIWTDEALLLYIRDAEAKFASQTTCLRDSTTPEITQIVLVEGQAEYPLDKRVISVQEAVLDGRTVLGRTSWSTRFGASAPLTPNTSYTAPDEAGQPRIYYTDRDSYSIGLYPKPSAQQVGKTLRLQVARMPLNPLSKSNMDASSEIPEQYHLDLLEWAAWRALRNHDPDLDNDANSIALVRSRFEQHRTRFEAAVAECKRQFKYLNVKQVEFAPRANWR
jgi:hypothetical protein